MKTIIFLLLATCLVSSSLYAQKFMTRSGHIWFFSHTAVEDIEAHNRQSNSILDSGNGDIVFQVLLKSFQFEKALMQEHFNEKYVESDKYPKASFKGNIKDYDSKMLEKDGTYEVVVIGEMTLHGKTQPVEAMGTLEKKDGKITAKSDFKLKLEEYDIKVPSVVREKIAEEIEIHVDLVYDSI